MLAPQLVSRLARRLHAEYQAREAETGREEQAAWQRLAARQQALALAGRRLKLAQSHGLELVLPATRAELSDSAGYLRDALDNLRNLLDLPLLVPPTTSFLTAELRQLEDEFGPLRIDWRRGVIAVTTAQITLEGIALGAFDIELVWPRLVRESDAGCFEIVALSPNPAAGDDSVTHPHVKDQRLCAGEGARALARALDEGRLVDAFHLVSGVLFHYNPSSPYIALDLWDGATCADCGAGVSASELSYCDGCQDALCEDCVAICAACRCVTCGECSWLCTVCEATVCSNCIRTSSHSDRNCCPRCLGTCANCNAKVAEDELDEATGRCPGCVSPPANDSAMRQNPDPSDPEIPHDSSTRVAAAG